MSTKFLEPQVQEKLSNEFSFFIRIAQPKDINSITEILTNSFYSYQGIMGYARPFLRLGIYEDLRNRIRSKSEHYLCLVAMVVKNTESTKGVSTTREREQDLIGTVEIDVRSRSGMDVLLLNSWQLDNFEYAYLSNLAVDANYRKLGVAQQLLSYCEQKVLGWGFCELYLHVLENNYTARRLYDKAGYQLQEVEWTFGSLLFGQPRKLLLRKSFSSKI
ncbi:MAG: GNAT family N-acetyltransferase [Okeania sp. SIO3B3]|nr:GNAT family N-acetyltransferase [Okeania sp. SIO3B3]